MRYFVLFHILTAFCVFNLQVSLVSDLLTLFALQGDLDLREAVNIRKMLNVILKDHFVRVAPTCVHLSKEVHCHVLG